MKALALFPKRRAGLRARVARGEAPDTLLMGLNHLGDHGIDVQLLDPPLGRGGLLQQAIALTRLRDFDAVICKDLTSGTLLSRFAGARRPPLLYLDVVLNSPSRPGTLLGPLVRGADGYVVCTRALRGLLVQNLGLPPAAIHHVPWGVDTRFFQPSEGPWGNFLLAVGDNDRDYGPLLQAARQLGHPLVIASRRRDLPRIHSCHLTVDSFSPTELRTLYAMATAVVVPLHDVPSASGATAVLEAQAMARCVVTTASRGIEEYIIPGETALRVSANAPAALRRALGYVLEDEGLRRTMGGRGRRFVADHRDTRHTAAGIVAALGRCLHFPSFAGVG